MCKGSFVQGAGKGASVKNEQRAHQLGLGQEVIVTLLLMETIIDDSRDGQLSSLIHRSGFPLPGFLLCAMLCLKLLQQPLCVRQLTLSHPYILPTHPVLKALPHPSPINDPFDLPFSLFKW